MSACNVALFGCGTVGTGVARILLGDGPLASRLSREVRLKYIVDARVDAIRDELGDPDSVCFTTRIDEVLEDEQVEVAVELFGGTEAARELVLQAVRSGKDVVTANKALLAEHGDEIYRVARENGASIAFEAAVGGGIPIIAALREGFVGDRIDSVYGIVNGTSNYILTRMLGGGISYDEALREAQEKGYAEADPTLDVEGMDSAHKLAVLARIAFGKHVDINDIPCRGVAGMRLQDLIYARALGYAVKLLAVGVRRDGALELAVHPALLRADHPMAAIAGAYNAICVHGSHVGEVVLTGLGAGREPTASAVVGDIARVAMGTYRTTFGSLAQFGQVDDADITPPGELEARYYVRLDCVDRAGVLAQVAGILGEEAISVASVRQQEAPEPTDGLVPVVLMTHRTRDAAVRRARDRISRLEVVRGETICVLKVQDL